MVDKNIDQGKLLFVCFNIQLHFSRQQSFWSILLLTIEMQSGDHFVVISVVDENID